MNKINFNQTGGFPLDTDILAFMQNAYAVFNSLGELAGNLSILKGCEVTGINVANGYVYINGEVLPFRGGSNSQQVVIKEERRSLPFEDGENKEVEIVRYATFGNGTTTYNWADFKRIKNLQDINTESFESDNSLLKRLEKLERRVTKTVPIGLVAIWDKPADQIPEGWVEHTEMQGFTPVGHKAGDTDFGQLGATLGNKTHRLTISELPRTELDIINKNGSGFEVMGNGHRHIDDWHRRGGQWANGHSLPQWGKERGSQLKASLAGQDLPHNNIQPSRIVRFIRFVGFND